MTKTYMASGLRSDYTAYNQQDGNDGVLLYSRAAGPLFPHEGDKIVFADNQVGIIENDKLVMQGSDEPATARVDLTAEFDALENRARGLRLLADDLSELIANAREKARG